MIRQLLNAAVVLGAVAVAGTMGESCTNSDAGTTIAIDSGNVCICDSGRYDPAECDSVANSACVDFTTIGSQPANTVDVGMQVTLAEMDSTNLSLAVMTIRSEAKKGRKFMAFSLVGCGSNRFTKLETATTSSDVANGVACHDIVKLGIDVNLLDVACGFDVSPSAFLDGENGQLYRWYNGSVLINYTEPVVIGAAGSANDTRYVSTTLPVNFKLIAQFNATLNATTNITSPFNLTAAVTQQIVFQPDLEASTLSLTYAIHWPYDVLRFKKDLANTSSSLVPTVTFPNVLNPGDTSYVESERCQNGTGTNDYTFLEATGICRRTIILQFDHPKANVPRVCELDGTYTLQNVVIQCSPDIPSVDCPLQLSDNTSSITITLDSDNFCQDQGSIFTINDVIKIVRFISPTGVNLAQREASTTSQFAWEWGRPAYFRVDLQGPSIQTVTLTKWERKFNGEDDSQFTDIAIYVKVDNDNGLSYQQGVTGNGNLGLQNGVTTGVTQAYWLVQVIDNVVLSDPGPGRFQRLIFRVTFQVDYVANARRRRSFVRREIDSGTATVSAQGTVYGQSEEQARQLAQTGGASTTTDATSLMAACMALAAILLH